MAAAFVSGCAGTYRLPVELQQAKIHAKIRAFGCRTWSYTPRGGEGVRLWVFVDELTQWLFSQVSVLVPVERLKALEFLNTM